MLGTFSKERNICQKDDVLMIAPFIDSCHVIFILLLIAILICHIRMVPFMNNDQARPCFIRVNLGIDA